ncbi:MAG: hypothetical protein KF894_06415 [Labilithrix sp.]|nr:hypothetical protein [Labilithrix sp.]
MGSLAIERVDASASELAARSRAWDADRGEDARLTIGSPSDEAIVLGAFQRASELEGQRVGAAGVDAPLAVLRRGSGGAAARVGPGCVWLQLSLARPDALVACTADKILNRYVRPLLRALTRAASVPASWFGRDWISAAHRPVALVALAHDAAANRALFEAIVGVSASVACGDRPSFLGKAPATLDEIAGRAVDPARVATLAAEAYAAAATSLVEASAAGGAPRGAPASGVEASAARGAARVPASGVEVGDPAWAAIREEAIGVVAAGRDVAGRLRVGGELMASRDALARLEDLVAALPSGAGAAEVGRAVDVALTTPGAVTFGVRAFVSLRDAIVDALRSPAP